MSLVTKQVKLGTLAMILNFEYDINYGIDEKRYLLVKKLNCFHVIMLISI